MTIQGTGSGLRELDTHFAVNEYDASFQKHLAEDVAPQLFAALAGSEISFDTDANVVEFEHPNGRVGRTTRSLNDWVAVRWFDVVPEDGGWEAQPIVVNRIIELTQGTLHG